MTRRRSVQDLVKPLRKLALLSNKSRSTLNVEPSASVEILELRQNTQPKACDSVSCLPREVALQIFSSLSFDELVCAQLTCRHWRGIAQDPSLWRHQCRALHEQHPEIPPLPHAKDRPWQEQYYRTRVNVNWHAGAVQRLHLIHQRKARILSLKLRDSLLVTLSEDNHVRLYEHTVAGGFQLRWKWAFDAHHIVECVDVLSEINILVVALRGAKCLFYDIHKQSNDPIQVLKGGSHPWFVPNAITMNEDYFAVAGRKPSALFVWNWRKGIHLTNKAFDNQSRSVHVSGNHLILVSTDGAVRVFDLMDLRREPIHFSVSPCNIPCLAYDGARSLVLASTNAQRLHHYRWDAQPPSPSSSPSRSSSPFPDDVIEPSPPQLTSSTTYPSLLKTRRQLSATLSSFLQHGGRKTSKVQDQQQPSRPRRHSSYNNYGYACQMRTNRYIQRRIKAGNWPSREPLDAPGFTTGRLRRIKSIRTTSLRRTAQDVLSIAVHNDRVATVNRHGDIALYSLDGATAARVVMQDAQPRGWKEDNTTVREDDDLSDGYNTLRTRLAIGSMGIIYGTRSGALWWLDFGISPNV